MSVAEDLLDLTQEHCEPCRSGEGKLGTSEAVTLMGELNDWTFFTTRIEKHWEFKNFKQALALVAKVASIAEQENHHPEIRFGWGYVEVVLTTHSIGSLTRNDFIVAAKIDAIA